MPENLYPKLPSAPSISQESFNVETSGNTIKTLLILRINMMKNSGSIKMLVIDC